LLKKEKKTRNSVVPYSPALDFILISLNGARPDQFSSCRGWQKYA